MMSVARSIPDHQVVPPAVADADGPAFTVEATYIFRPDFPGFDGHFPDNPLLPGIAQIMAVVQTVCHDRAGTLHEVKRCKFTRPVQPLERLNIVVAVTESAMLRHCRASLFAEGEAASTISLTVAMQE